MSLVAIGTALVSALLGAAAHADYQQEVAKDHPIVWLRFQDAAETGPVGGKATRFNGKDSVVEIPPRPELALNNISVEFWFKSTQKWDAPYWPGSATFVSKATEGNSSGDWTIIGGDPDGRIIVGVGPKPGTDMLLRSPPGVNDGDWHHVVWIRSATGDNRLYLDGVPVAGAKDSGGTIANDRPIQIGGDPWLRGKFLDGALAEVAIYGTVLDEARVAAHFQAAGLPPRKPCAKPQVALTSQPETAAGWVKHAGNPVLGGNLGTCFDIAVLKEGDTYRMWFSWRPKKSVALVESKDGIHWSEPGIVLGPRPETGWEDDINRPVVVKRDDGFHLWYTGQAKGHSWIGYATSADGRTWKRMSDKPVVSAEQLWEKVAVMCPHVIWDPETELFRMWYSGGEQYEPDAIGYATSPDGLRWTKHADNPVFRSDPNLAWEQHKVTACQVIRHGDWFLMFYIGFRDRDHAQIGVARSRDGITNWQRHPANPIIRPGENKWDGDACYKSFAIFDGAKWLLWYNGRRGNVEQIGLATHEGEDLGFPPAPVVLKAETFKHYVDSFNQNDNELYTGAFPNAAAWDFLERNIPLFECPDKGMEEIYYFRWWTYRKHIKPTPVGFIIDEFLPNVGWAGKYNSISCAAGHHFYEGRWLSNPQYLDDYTMFWFRKGGEPRRYSFWAANALVARYLVDGNKALVVDLLPDLVRNYEAWEKSHLDPNGLFWQIDDRDGGEMSIGGHGYRATINSYQYGDAVAIAHIAELAGKPELTREYRDKAAKVKQLVQEKLWDQDAQFFKVLPRGENRTLVDVRELHGYTPWYFNLPDPLYAVAWKQVIDSKGFCAPFGPTTAEQRHPKFALSYQGHECQWNGPSWPYATAVTLTGMANLLNGPPQDAVTAKDYFYLLKIYTKSHRLKLDDGRVVPWIDENLNPLTGDWISRTRLKSWKNGTWDAGKGGEERGKDYNHSTYCDLIITGLVGLRPRPDNIVEVNPLVPEGTWDHFCLDRLLYHGHILTILYDKTGRHYNRGKGMRVLCDGDEIAASENLGRLTGKLP